MPDLLDQLLAAWDEEEEDSDEEDSDEEDLDEEDSDEEEEDSDEEDSDEEDLDEEDSDEEEEDSDEEDLDEEEEEDEEDEEEDSDEEEEDSDETTQQTQLERQTQLESWLSHPDPELRYILDPVLSLPGSAELYGPTGAGKTWLATGLAVAVASGQDWLCWPCSRPHRVAYIAGPDMSYARMRERIRTQIEIMDPGSPARYCDLLDCQADRKRILRLSLARQAARPDGSVQGPGGIRRIELGLGADAAHGQAGH